MNSRICLNLIFLLFINWANAQTVAPKREFRGVWIATVEKYLSGKQGQAPYPLYDPLEFAIKATHQHGMELHAWFNPYRATKDLNFSSLSPQHITNTHPEWFFIYGGQKLFDPGILEVREYIIKVILDVVDNYDVDGIHLDDYFYPYHIAGQQIYDEQTFKKYGAGFSNVNDWRRNNVNLLVKMLNDSIHQHNPRVKFGMSPSGVWANKIQNPGAQTRMAAIRTMNFMPIQKNGFRKAGLITLIRSFTGLCMIVLHLLTLW